MSSNAKKTNNKQKKNKIIDNSNDNDSDNERWNLIKEATDLKQDVKKEEALLSDFKEQLERIKYHWQVMKDKCKEKNVESLKKQTELQQIMDDHQISLDLNKQKIKQVLFQHQTEISLNLKAIEYDHKNLHDDFLVKDQELNDDLHHLHSRMKETELSNINFIQRLKRKHENELTDLIEMYSIKASEITASSEHVMKVTKEQRELQIQQTITELENEKDIQIKEIMQLHEKELNALRKDYNETTQRNLSIIKEKKRKLKELKKVERINEKSLKDVKVRNKNITEPLQQGNNDIMKLKQKLKLYQMEKMDLEQTKGNLGKLQRELNDLKWKHEVLFQRFIALEKERDDYQNKVQESLYEAQQKSDLKNVLLDKKIQNISHKRDHKIAFLNEMLQHENYNPNIMMDIKTKITNIMEEKDKKIKTIELALNKMIKDRHK